VLNVLDQILPEGTHLLTHVGSPPLEALLVLLQLNPDLESIQTWIGLIERLHPIPSNPLSLIQYNPCPRKTCLFRSLWTVVGSKYGLSKQQQAYYLW
jgi:hypothetical protein